jgi:type VI secretion system secreted protein Hcp
MAVDYFFKIDSIPGESQDEKHKNEIQLLSWSHGLNQVSSVGGTGGSGAGKVSLSDFSAMCYFDKSTPKFFKNICKGIHIPSGTLTATKSGADNKPYLTFTFSEIFITSLQYSASSEVPAVSLSFTFNEIKMDYSIQDEKGNLNSVGAVTMNTKTNTFS